MEGLAPPLKCLIEIQSALQNGETVQKGLTKYLGFASLSKSDDQFALQVRKFLFAWDQGQDWQAIIAQSASPQRKALFELIASALAGQPVLSHLEELKGELIEACQADIDHHLELLPIYMLAPLLIFQFPAFLLLLFGPLLARLLQELSR